MKYHPACPDSFDTVQDIADCAAKFQELYNNHPHSALGYVRPNDEHAGLGNAIRAQRKENLLAARKARLEHYHAQKAGVSNYGAGEDRGSTGIVGADSEGSKTENEANQEKGFLEVKSFLSCKGKYETSLRSQ